MTLIANATKVIATRFLCASVKTKQSYHKCLALMLLSLYFSCGWGMKQCTESTKRARKKLGWRPAETKNFPSETPFGISMQPSCLSKTRRIVV